MTVKCRIGVDEQDPEAVLPAFLAQVAAAGVARFVVHARKAWLQGLSPKENREIPPLDHALVVRMKAARSRSSRSAQRRHRQPRRGRGPSRARLDGVMIGRAAYHAPSFSATVDRAHLRRPGPDVTRRGGGPGDAPLHRGRAQRAAPPLNQITRHMLGAFQGRPGARAWRRRLSEGAHRPGAGPELVGGPRPSLPRDRSDSAAA